MIGYLLQPISFAEMRRIKRNVIPKHVVPRFYSVIPGILEVWPPLPQGWRLDWQDDNGTRLVAFDESERLESAP